MTLIPRPPFHLNCRGIPLNLGMHTCIVGILNITPDSFADGGRFIDPARAIDHARALVEAGAHVIDIGGESTRPAGPYGSGAAPVTLDEELHRILPVVEALAPDIGVPLSIDTTKAEVARRALEAGAHIINDISALRFDPDMARVVAQYGAPVILMHMQGTPATMQANPTYTNLLAEVSDFLKARINTATAAGISPHQIVIDPGLGFGKTYAHNRELIARVSEFHRLQCPILIGPSRKKFTAPHADPPDRLPGTLAALALCLAGGAHIVRVHDVAETVQVAGLVDRMRADLLPSGKTP